ncbi:threonine aldolase family protein [Clostridium ihumii]|uniref:threonine aldolase family protein n=1 Tax=Clostridium ihumii TaxID=1470356 RepID=UPI00058D4424|nr:aminotransferase class I/II-fold pyridoxal phosphate-dependent enzyme [Clostridium ihumii]
MKTFISDNVSGVHPKVMEALLNANCEHEFSYGGDKYTLKAINKFRDIFSKKDLGVYFVLNGTGSNVTANSAAIRSYEAVIATDITHLHTDECGAFERISGSKIITVPNKDGKITIEAIKEVLHNKGNFHHSQPKIITISQLTEVGSAYTIDELKELCSFAKENDLYVHMDGARIANAAAGLNVTFKEMVTDTGIDIVSFGGTKNGMMFGEVILCFNEEIDKHMKYMIKHSNQLLSKMRFISAQFLAYLDEEVWKNNAKNANEVNNYLKENLEKIKGIDMPFSVDGNMILATMPKDIEEKIVENKKASIVNCGGEYVRLVASFDSTKADVDELISLINLNK